MEGYGRQRFPRLSLIIDTNVDAKGAVRLKKWSAFLLCAMMFFSLPFDAALAEYMYISSEDGSTVNLFVKMDVDSAVVNSIPHGAAVEVNQYIYGSSWASCNYNGYCGYVNIRQLSATPPGPVVDSVIIPTVKAISAPVPSSGSNLTIDGEGAYNNFNPAFYSAIVRPATVGGSVHMRWAPSQDAVIFDEYGEGSELWVLYSDGVWCQVFDPNNFTAGFVMEEYLAYTGPIAGGKSSAIPGFAVAKGAGG